VRRLLVALILSGCAAPAPPPAEPPVPPPPAPPAALARALEFDLPPADLGRARRVDLWATFYELPTVHHTPGGTPLLGADGQHLGPELSLADFCDAALQGSVRVLFSDRAVVYNYGGVGAEVADCRSLLPRFPATGRTRFRVARGPYGDGQGDRILVPYRTLAVDPAVIALDRVVYVPAARGAVVTLPDGSRHEHDGYFFAADRGGAIHGRHVDVFIGAAERCPFAFVGSRPSATFAAYLVDAPLPRQVLGAAHRLDGSAPKRASQ
jgi:3D (Asp-Asp-Asp) domain-containing protein